MNAAGEIGSLALIDDARRACALAEVCTGGRTTRHVLGQHVLVFAGGGTRTPRPCPQRAPAGASTRAECRRRELKLFVTTFSRTARGIPETSRQSGGLVSLHHQRPVPGSISISLEDAGGRRDISRYGPRFQIDPARYGRLPLHDCMQADSCRPRRLPSGGWDRPGCRARRLPHIERVTP